jgi:DNA polymerase-3 subunit gamma/tau
MSYQVLARKWRPHTFDEVAGQEHVLRALINALDNDRLHHAYLFTGTRGVGKTTLARILAKCLNCEQGVSSKACGECSACTEINEGRFIDLIEVDAASRTKVEDTRELLDNVQYLPTRGRYKVYLIDEVHMLSTHSFNALLKTLEEPPPHAKFLLATTDPQKLPVTVLSRCLQFNLKNLSPERIVDYLKGILDKENVPFEEAALWALARAADGSMRDALSLTDQGIAHGDGKLTANELSTMLGTIDRSTVLDICRQVAERNASAVLGLVEALAEHAPDYSGALAEILSIWHRVAVVQAVPGALDNSLGDQEVIRELAEKISREDVQLFYQICLLGRRDLPLAADPRSGLEMVLLRQLAFQPVLDEGLDPPTLSAESVSSVRADSPSGIEEGVVDSKGGIEAAKKPDPDRLTVEVPHTTQAVDRSDQAESRSTASSVESEYAQLADESSVVSDPVLPESVVENMPVEKGAVDDGFVDGPLGPELEPEIVPELAPACSESTLPEQAGAVFTAQQWLETCHQLDIQGRLLNVASNLEFVERAGQQFLFRLDKIQSALYNDGHQQELATALQAYFAQNPEAGAGLDLSSSISVLIEIAPVSAETPELYRLRKRAERQAQAVQTLRDDPLVKELEQRFGARVIEDSVIPLD